MVFSDLDHLLTYIVLGTAAGRRARPSVAEDKKNLQSVDAIKSTADTKKERTKMCDSFFSLNLPSHPHEAFPLLFHFAAAVKYKLPSLFKSTHLGTDQKGLKARAEGQV